MKRAVLFGVIGLFFSLVSTRGYGVIDGDTQEPNPEPPKIQMSATALEDVIVEFKAPPLVDLKLPVIKGWKTTYSAIMSRLNSSKIRGFVSITLKIFIEAADRWWSMTGDSRIRKAGFENNLDLFMLFCRLWSGLGLLPKADSSFMIEKARLAISEFAAETTAIQTKTSLAQSHQQLIEDIKNLALQAGIPASDYTPEIKNEFFAVLNGVALQVPMQLRKEVESLSYVKRVARDEKVNALGDGFIPPNVDLIGAPAMWAQGYTGKYYTMAILDTGADMTQVDLRNNIWINQYEISIPACTGSPLDDDGDGLITFKDLNAIWQARPAKSNACVNDFDGDGIITGKDLVYRENQNVCDGEAGTPSAVNPLVNCTDDDGDGKIDDIVGWNYYRVYDQNGNQIANTINPSDDHYHGTHCAGIAAGNGVIKGVAPEASVLPVKVLDLYGSGWSSIIIAGMDYVVNTPYPSLAQVMSMSLGGGGDANSPGSLATDRAMDAGVIVAAAAGNAGPNLYTIHSPGSSRKAITVGASDNNDNIAGFSSRGPTFPDLDIKPDIVAPGVSICASRYDGVRESNVCDEDGNGVPEHIRLSGTSMATPHIAGAALLVKQKYPYWTSAQVKAFLTQTAVDLGQSPYAQGAGRVNLADAGAALASVEPQSINFGFDDLAQSVWVSAGETVTITNLSTRPHRYELHSAGQFPAGVSYNITPSYVFLAPGLSGKFRVTITVDNNVTPNADPPGFYFDRLLISSDGVNIADIHTRFAKSCFLTTGCDDCYSVMALWIYDDNTGYFGPLGTAMVKVPLKCGISADVCVLGFVET